MNQAYPVVLAVGCLAGLGWLVARRASSADSDGAAFKAALAAIGLGLAGARFTYVALHEAYFRRHPLEALWIWEGGLSWVGAAISVLVTVAVFARIFRRPPVALADGLAIPALLVALAAWTGCLLDRCVYGIPSDLPFALAAPDIFGTRLPRWPTAAAGMIATGFLVAGLIAFQNRRWPRGSPAAVALGGLAAIGLALSFTRADPALLLGGLRLDAWGALALLLLAAGGATLTRIRRRPS